MFRAIVTVIGTWTFLAFSGGNCLAQVIFPGSTPQGDILRGEGIFLQGAGLFNYFSAEANSINADTWMRLNEYIFLSVRAASMRESRRIAARLAKTKKNYDEILDRLNNNPEFKDIRRGDALNMLYQQLTDPKITESSFRFEPVQLSGDIIRNIPFLYAKEDATFSMQRLTARGRWPVGFRDDRLAGARRNYELAVDNALELQIEGKLTPRAVQDVENAVYDLSVRLDQVIPPSRDKVYLEARNHVRRLERMKELFKRKDIEQIVGELEKYAGTSVHDLVIFMKRNNLRFGVPDEIGDEQSLYTQLFAALKQQADLVKVPEITPVK